MTKMMEKPGLFVESKSINQERNSATRALSDQCFAPMVGDGEHTKKLLAEIQNVIEACASDNARNLPRREGGYSDLAPKWRSALRKARYLDWKHAQGVGSSP